MNLNRHCLFTAMFKDGWIESGKILTIEDYDEDTVGNFIDFIYEGQLSDKTKFNIQLLAMAHQYQVFLKLLECATRIGL